MARITIRNLDDDVMYRLCVRVADSVHSTIEKVV